MASRGRRGRGYLRLRWGCFLLWWGRCGCFGLRCGCLGLWCGSFGLGCGGRRLSWCGQRLLCSRRGCRDRRRNRLHRRRRDLGRLGRNDLPHGGWPDQCDEHRAVCTRLRPLRSQPGRQRQLRRTHDARGGGYQGHDHRTFGTLSPATHSHCLRCGHAPTWPSRRASHLAVCTKAQW
jgi:hypothetical protein